MAIGIYFSGLITPEQYDEAMKRIEGAPPPKGRQYHVAFSEGGDKLAIFDIWDSQADFDAFFAQMGPLLTELGVAEAQPAVVAVHNIITG